MVDFNRFSVKFITVRRLICYINSDTGLFRHNDERFVVIKIYHIDFKDIYIIINQLLYGTNITFLVKYV